MNVYVNDEDVRVQQGLETGVSAGDTVVILPAMAGGADRTAPRALVDRRPGVEEKPHLEGRDGQHGHDHE